MTNMSAPSSPNNPDWQPPRVPRLSYRKPLSAEEAAKLPQREQTASARTIGRAESSAISGATSANLLAPSSSTKKKGSFLSGIFAKEPTLTALAQVEADLRSKHGSATPQSVPHVSSRKMPDHVPKVNSKWDGVPEAVKAKEREERRNRRLSQRSSGAPSQSARSYSHDRSTCESSSHDRNLQRRGSDASSQVNSWSSHRGAVSVINRPTSTYSTTPSNDSSGHVHRTALSVRAESLRSPSGTSLPEITSFFPHHQEQSSFVPQRWQSVTSAMTSHTQATKSSDHSKSDLSTGDTYGSSVDVIPDHSSSPFNTPREMSPVTPGYTSDRVESPDQTSMNADASNTLRTSKRARPTGIDAFLAGEAKPLDLDEKPLQSGQTSDLPLRRFQQSPVDRFQEDVARRPDSSRARLGLRASMVMRTEAAPWETQSPSVTESASSGLSVPRNRFPKKLALFR